MIELSVDATIQFFYYICLFTSTTHRVVVGALSVLIIVIFLAFNILASLAGPTELVILMKGYFNHLAADIAIFPGYLASPIIQPLVYIASRLPALSYPRRNRTQHDRLAHENARLQERVGLLQRELARKDARNACLEATLSDLRAKAGCDGSQERKAVKGLEAHVGVLAGQLSAERLARGDVQGRLDLSEAKCRGMEGSLGRTGARLEHEKGLIRGLLEDRARLVTELGISKLENDVMKASWALHDPGKVYFARPESFSTTLVGSAEEEASGAEGDVGEWLGDKDEGIVLDEEENPFVSHDSAEVSITEGGSVLVTLDGSAKAGVLAGGEETRGEAKDIKDRKVLKEDDGAEPSLSHELKEEHHTLFVRISAVVDNNQGNVEPAHKLQHPWGGRKDGSSSPTVVGSMATTEDDIDEAEKTLVEADGSIDLTMEQVLAKLTGLGAPLKTGDKAMKNVVDSELSMHHSPVPEAPTTVTVDSLFSAPSRPVVALPPVSRTLLPILDVRAYEEFTYYPPEEPTTMSALDVEEGPISVKISGMTHRIVNINEI